jgi:predicted phosphodiesterase
MLLNPGDVPADREAAYRLGDARAQVDEVHLRRIAAWPTSRELTVGGRTLLLVHGSPTEPLDGYVYPDTDLAPFADVPYDAVVMGHTHRPFVRSCGGKVFVNAGSIGLPRDRGDLAAFALYDSAADRFETVRVPLDVPAILAAYGDRIADTVRACLLRR